ncbi:MAG: UDP-N-acetylenolpyruvoylglucosamine reductase, partial [Bdellovibrionales bacterium RIFOXYD1_FULL_44_7]
MKTLNWQKNVILAPFTSFKIGGLAQYFLKVKDKKSLIKALCFVKEKKIKLHILGLGSNVLIPDKGLRGLVLKLENKEVLVKKNRVLAGAGISLSELLILTQKQGFCGLEWAAGIPGTLGGAIFGNAGAFAFSMADIVESVEVFDLKDGEIRVIKNKDCKFGYRQSIFSKKPNWVILSAALKFVKDNKKKIKDRIKENLDYKKSRQPLNLPSAGSVFKNQKRIIAWQLIEKSG